jgi:hypothetical protein
MPGRIWSASLSWHGVVSGAAEAPQAGPGRTPHSCCLADLAPGPSYIGVVAVLMAGAVEVEIRPAEEVLAIDLV